MNTIIELINELSNTTQNPETSLYIGIIIIILGFLFKYFLKQRNDRNELELEHINNVLISMNRIILKIDEYENGRITKEEIYSNILSIIPYCSKELREMIFGYNLDKENISEETMNNRMNQLIEKILIDYKQACNLNKSNIFNRISPSTITSFEYVFKTSGLQNLFTAIGLTFISFFLMILFFMFSGLIGQFSKPYEMLIIIVTIIFISYYFIIFVLIYDMLFNTHKLTNKVSDIVLLIIDFILPLLVLLIKTDWSLFLFFAIYMCLTYYILHYRLERKSTYRS